MSNSDICKFEGCERGIHAKGYCKKHYNIQHEKKTEERNKTLGNLCEIEGCERGVLTDGCCRTHYLTKKSKKMEESNRKKGKICKIEGCEKGGTSKGYCTKHYNQSEHKRKKEAIFKNLGQYECQRCGFDDKRALTLDHIHDDGYLEKNKSGVRRPIVQGKTGRMYVNNPELCRKKLQVLCQNCNFIKELERRKRLTGDPDLVF